MSEKITYSLQVQVAGGPRLGAAQTLEVQAYDKAQVTLVGGDSDIQVNIQPAGPGLAQLIVITASTYGDDLTYKVNDAGATAVALDGPHCFIGPGAVGLLDAAPAQLFFSNGATTDTTVHILVGRAATP